MQKSMRQQCHKKSTIYPWVHLHCFHYPIVHLDFPCLLPQSSQVSIFGHPIIIFLQQPVFQPSLSNPCLISSLPRGFHNLIPYPCDQPSLTKPISPHLGFCQDSLYFQLPYKPLWASSSTILLDFPHSFPGSRLVTIPVFPAHAFLVSLQIESESHN